MDSYMNAPNTKRFVVEDSITKVTSDGEPHEVMTLIAGFSGLLAAIVILAVLISLISCKKSSRVKNCNGYCVPTSVALATARPSASSSSNDSSRSSIATNYTRATSITEVAEDDEPPQSAANQRHESIAIIYGSNLGGNLNSAFVGSELTLSDCLAKPHKERERAHCRGECETGCARVRETTIDIERY